jgi:hypothetical protein
MNQEDSFEVVLLSNLQNVTKQSSTNPMFDAVKEYKEKIVPDIIKFLQLRKSNSFFHFFFFTSFFVSFTAHPQHAVCNLLTPQE